MISYRKAGKEDIEELVSLRIDFLREVKEVPDTGKDIAGELRRYFTEHLEDGTFVNWIATDGDAIVGTGGLCVFHIPANFIAKNGRWGYILNVYTLPQYRKLGIAYEIMGRLLQAAREMNITKVSLHTTKTGKSLYEQFGFKVRDNEMELHNDEQTTKSIGK